MAKISDAGNFLADEILAKTIVNPGFFRGEVFFVRFYGLISHLWCLNAGYGM